MPLRRLHALWLSPRVTVNDRWQLS
jgi:hypothetical protein